MVSFIFSATPMDINDIRITNYQQLLNEFRGRSDQLGKSDHGLIKRFAEHAGLSAQYLSHINSGRKQIGDVVARKMESGCSKVYGWLDEFHGSESEGVNPAERAFVSKVTQLYRKYPQEMHDLVESFMLNKLLASDIPPKT